ncbi:MAG: hypothetical protein WCX31_04590 [Salinivirgaceae bacterium]|jgi:hypothetical protein
MNLTEEQLQKVKELAALFLSPDEIAVLMGVDIDSLVNEIASRKGTVYCAYLLGKSESKKAIRENIIKMAKHGSPQAEELAERYIKEQELEERKHGRKYGTHR